ncbi:2,4-dihydroxyhept-2-ene-1,7-dioic acid aldolase [Actinoplanes cyaneus]|uniref:2,4-dihydroxyhept-2-ene-1,7-dioic acid aldolase n=1 Tax=Actinoplanes cyaneus TaxID=52696 RepID=A0A919IJH9_9ACTN|nr:aldolase/citrate lyase family protein [Actinoplanes cyaneus]MCW2140333.1 2-dehydro-3-deoxyglucarate aldolase/4-hydroxy-2-oxoheptanedioate aldolase [Actinoplanes cyaneus]GID65651.1 2,4-dihydroxyhept-2-ene-1,7-dioic acid aldolase [Actinoplanes cyaneus]
MSGLRARLAAGDTLFGTFLGLGSPLATEACAVAGFDWLLVDLEHGGGDEQALLHQQLAGEARRVPMLARVESAERIRTGRLLDTGVSGVMFPRLDSVEEVRAAVRHLRYPPEGDRGVATYNRVYDFGLRPEGLGTANDGVVGIVQIESRGALRATAEIAAVPGVDVLFVGPRDLSTDLGCAGRFEAAEFTAALDQVLSAAKNAGIAAGILAGDPRQAAAYTALGFRFVGVGSDASLLARAASDAVGHLRGTIAT